MHTRRKIQRRFLASLALLCVSACTAQRGANVAPELQGAVAAFYAAATERGVTVPPPTSLAVLLERPDRGTEDGHCHVDGDGARIQIDPAFAQYATAERLEVAILHELGHCLLGRVHRNVLVPGTEWPRLDSIMASTLIEGDEYVAHKAEYLDELFSGGDASVRNRY